MSVQEEKSIAIEIGEGGTATALVPLEDTVVEDKKPKGDARVGRDPDEDDDSGDDTSGQGTRPTESQNRRRRQNQKRRREENEREIGELRAAVGSQQQLLEALTRGQREQAMMTLQGEASSARSAHAEAKARHAKAVTDGDGAAASEALNVMTNAERYYNQVAGQYNNLAKQVPAARRDDEGADDEGDGRRQQQQQPRLTKKQIETINELKEDFLDRNNYIDLASNTAVQRAIKAIDNDVAKDGFDPMTEDYWLEVEDRIKEEGLDKVAKEQGGRRMRREEPNDRRERREPARRQADDDDERGGPPLGGSGRGRGGGGETLTLSNEMVKALEDANIPLTGGDANTVKRRNNILKSWQTSKPK